VRAGQGGDAAPGPRGARRREPPGPRAGAALGRALGPQAGEPPGPRQVAAGAAPDRAQGRMRRREGRGHAQGRGERGRRERERERERGREGGRGRAHLGDPNPAITVTGSPRERGGRERWKRGRGSCCSGKTNERKGEGGRAGRAELG
jgi:hypothetical protein